MINESENKIRIYNACFDEKCAQEPKNCHKFQTILHFCQIFISQSETTSQNKV